MAAIMTMLIDGGLLGWGLVLASATLLLVAVYRLLLSPLAGVPGPKIAALTAWYEFYWDCPRQGHYMFKIEEMHQKYGLSPPATPPVPNVPMSDYFSYGPSVSGKLPDSLTDDRC